MHNKKLVLGLTALLAVVALVVGWFVAGSASAATVKAATRVTSFNASPEPIASGDDLTIAGKLERKSTTWVPLTSSSVSIQRKLTGGKYLAYKTVTTDGLGAFKLVLPVNVSASYRAVYAGSSKYASFTGVGDNVQVAATKIVASTQVVNWPDTDAANGVWAKDHFKRTLTVTRGAKVAGGYSYAWSVVDEGGFVSGHNVPSPNTPAVLLHGVVRGSFDGGMHGSFVANTRYLTAANVPVSEDAEVDGKVATSSEWAKLALPTGVVVSTWDPAVYSWVYEAPGTCETFTQATEGNAGNILGINACE